MSELLMNDKFIKNDIFINTLNTEFDSVYFEKILMKYYDDLMSYKINKFKTKEECVDYINKLIPILENISYWKNTKALMLFNLLDLENKEERDTIVNCLIKVEEDINNKLQKFEEI